MFNDAKIKRLEERISKIRVDMAKLPALERELADAREKQKKFLERKAAFEKRTGIPYHL